MVVSICTVLMNWTSGLIEETSRAPQSFYHERTQGEDDQLCTRHKIYQCLILDSPAYRAVRNKFCYLYLKLVLLI